MEEKHKFTTFDTVTVLSLVAGVVFLVGAIVTNALIDQKLDRATSRSRQLAMQLLVGGVSAPPVDYRKLNTKQPVENSQKPDLGRSPASTTDWLIDPVGRIGMDPWGAPYYYELKSTETGVFTVAVVSSGPNKKLETSLGSHALGDDISAIEKMQAH